jgi:glycosyltransferase involved in cell wall biosynthesis
MSLGVSIVICTYNGAARLPQTLHYIANQNVRPGIDWEVIIIDNNSSDDTDAVARQEWAKYGSSVPCLIRKQPVPGLTAARQMGFAIALYEYVVLCDDDNWLEPDYVNTVYDIMHGNNNIGVLGGNGRLAYGEEPPSWVMYLNLLAAGPQAPASGKVSRNIVYGAGCVVRKSAYELLHRGGFEFMLSDRMGSVLTSGGDHELCYALALAGYDIWYDDRLRFTHFITRDRLTWDYYLKYIKESSYCFYVLEPYKIMLNVPVENMLHFRLHLIRTFLYLFRKIVMVVYKRTRMVPHSSRYKAATLRFYILKARLTSYSKYSLMRSNFLKVAALKKRLHAVLPQVIPVEA